MIDRLTSNAKLTGTATAMFFRSTMAVAIVLASFSTSANALCNYNGVDYAKTTVQQEFRDSKWVAKIRVMSIDDHYAQEYSSVESWSSYRLEILQTFKGSPPDPVRFFTYRDSAGFYFDSIGSEYLVFLNPNAPYKGQPQIERGTAFVNYACGQSKLWNKVTPDEQELLKRLSQHKP